MTGTPTVLIVAPPAEPLPARRYGGVERAVYELHRALRGAGFESDILCPQDSDDAAQVIRATTPSVRSALLAQPQPNSGDVERMELKYYREAFELARHYTAIHLHHLNVLSYWNQLDVADTTKCLISIYQDTSSPQVRELMRQAPPNVAFVANSAHTRSKYPEARWAATILEGVPTQRIEAREHLSSDTYATFIGVIRPHKGVLEAIQACKIASIPLKVIGPMNLPFQETPSEDRIYTEQVRSELSGVGEYLGELGESRLDVLRGSLVHLSPANWEEPFGRSNAEALCCGTPVVSFDRGAIRELIIHRRHGLFVSAVDEMAKAITTASELSRQDCRQRAVDVLDIKRVASQHIDLYSRYAGSKCDRSIS